MKKNVLSLLIIIAAAPSLLAGVLPQFASVGFANSQTARINVRMGAEPHLYPPGPCSGVIQLTFYNDAGDVLAQKTARLEPTAVESLELTQHGDSIARRTQVHADVSWVTYPPGPCRGNVFGNVEVYSNITGETMFVLHGAPQDSEEIKK